MPERSRSEPKAMSRRQALAALGLAAAVGYAVPTVLTVSDAEAGAAVIHRSRRYYRRSHPWWWYRRRHRSDWRYRRRTYRRDRY